MTVNVSAPSTATVGQPYFGTVTATGGVPPYTWTAVTGLPDGITATVSGATLTLSGTPIFTGYSLVYGQAIDSYFTPQPGTWWIDLTVSWAKITISCNLPAATVGQPYTGTITATGGDGTPFTWSGYEIGGGLTSTVNGGTVTISGTPTISDVPASNPPEPGRVQLFIVVSDSQTSFSRECDLVIDP